MGLRYVAFRHNGLNSDPGSYWHIYAAGRTQDVLDPRGTILTLRGPDTPEMRKTVEALAHLIDAAAEFALRSTSRWEAIKPLSGGERTPALDQQVSLAGPEPTDHWIRLPHD